MFASAFPFSKINHCPPRKSGEYNVVEHVYNFRGKTNKRYIVIVEEYNYFVFVVKFYLQERKVHPDKFTKLTNLNECSRVLTTIGQIIRELYQKNPYASFGFIGTNLPNESKNNTKRFRLYSRVVEQVISPVLFEHRSSLANSAFLLLNRDNHEADLLKKIEIMFETIYQIELG